jgi:hypothetical protein
MLTQKEILQLEYNKKQLQFALDGSLIINKKVLDEQTPIDAIINEQNYYLCPFCLEKSNKYIIENKGLVKCPNCLVNMKVKTILFVQDCSNQEYAKWVYEYRLSGFFKKINFEKWSKKLKELGIVYEFWEEYKRLKGEDNLEEKVNNYDYLEGWINSLMQKISLGYTKEEIIVFIEDIRMNHPDFTDDISNSEFEYCYNEALTKINIEKGV